jgi:hypothetical protein
MAILPTDPSRQVAHSGHRVRAVLGLLSFLACIVFMMVGRIGLLVNSQPGRHPVSGFAITGIVCGIGAQLATAGVLSVWQSLYFSRYDVYGRAPPNFFMFAYAAFPLRRLPTLARKLPLWLATRMTRRFVHVVHVCTVLAYTMPVIVATLLLGSLFVNVPADDPNRLRIIDRAANTTEAFFLIFLILSLAWNIDFGLALIWNRHVGVAGGEGRRGVFGTALAQRQDLFVAIATAMQIICASQAVRIVSGACPYGEALNNGDAYIQAISDVTNFAFYCVFALALVDCVVPRSLLVSVEDTFTFTLVDRRRSAPTSAVRALDGERAAHVAANIFAEQRAQGPSARRASLDRREGAPPSARAERPTLLKRVSSRIGFARDADDSDAKAALYVDWRRARPDVLVLREAGPSHDIPPFESVELVNASARLGELMKATIALLLLIFRFTLLDRAFWQHLIVAIAFFLSLVSADSARTAALVMRPWVRLYRRREGREPPSGLAKPRPLRDALSSAVATLVFAALIATWIYLVVERDPIELGVGTYVTVTVFFVVQTVLVLFFAPFTTNRRTQVSERVQHWIERLTTHMPSVLTMGGNLSYSSSSADIALVDVNDDDDNDDDAVWLSRATSGAAQSTATSRSMTSIRELQRDGVRLYLRRSNLQRRRTLRGACGGLRTTC